MNPKIYQIILFCFCIISFSSNAQNCPDSCDYFLPNSITPDCDGINCGILKIESSCEFLEFEFSLLNRWGEIIFESTDPKMLFDSSVHEEGVYIWKLTGRYCNMSEFENLGQILILR